MNNILEAIHLMESKLEKLLSNYEFLKEENKLLLEENVRMSHLLEEKEQELKTMQEQYDLLKIAKTIEGSNQNTRETKLKINALIREIDKCIELLNV